MHIYIYIYVLHLHIHIYHSEGGPAGNAAWTDLRAGDLAVENGRGGLSSGARDRPRPIHRLRI